MLYALPRGRLKRNSQCLDWIDDFDSVCVHGEFCDWIAGIYSCASPVTNVLIASDVDAYVGLYRWNCSFATPFSTGETDGLLGIIGDGSPDKPIEYFATWMTQQQAWQMWSFFGSHLQSDAIIVEARYLNSPEA